MRVFIYQQTAKQTGSSKKDIVSPTSISLAAQQYQQKQQLELYKHILHQRQNNIYPTIDRAQPID